MKRSLSWNHQLPAKTANKTRTDLATQERLVDHKPPNLDSRNVGLSDHVASEYAANFNDRATHILIANAMLKVFRAPRIEIRVCTVARNHCPNVPVARRATSRLAETRVHLTPAVLYQPAVTTGSSTILSTRINVKDSHSTQTLFSAGA